MLRIFHNTKYEFIKHWKLAVALTVAFIAAGLVTFGITGGVNYSIEFTGGTELRLNFPQAPDVADVRAAIAGAGLGEAEITTFGEPNVVISASPRPASAMAARTSAMSGACGNSSRISVPPVNSML